MFDTRMLILAQDDEFGPPQLPTDGPVAEPTPDAAPGVQGAPGGGQPAPAPPQADPFGGPFLWILMIGVLVLIVFSMSGQRRDKKRREQMLTSIKKGNRVQTIGGILGTVVDVRDNEVVVKVDENTNARMRFAKSAIHSVTEEEKE